MKAFPWLVLLCAGVCIATSAQEKLEGARRARVFVTDSDSWETKSNGASGFGSGGGIFGGGAFSHAGGGARPQTAEVIKTLGQRCPNLIVNSRPEMGDYVLRLEHEGGKGLLAHKDKVVVFERRSGDSIFAASTISLGGSVQHACAAIDKHWAANAAALSASPIAAHATEPPMPQPAAEMATLLVDCNVAGADIEVDGDFAGNVPSTLAVSAGKHTVTVKKKGYAAWSRTLNISGSSIRLTAELTSGS